MSSGTTAASASPTATRRRDPRDSPRTSYTARVVAQATARNVSSAANAAACSPTSSSTTTDVTAQSVGQWVPPVSAVSAAFLPSPTSSAGYGSGRSNGPAQLRKLFIGGLSHETTDEQLRDFFSQWGSVVDSIVIRDPATKQSRGFGFVTFHTLAAAELAMLDRPHVIGGKQVDSKRAIPREQMAPFYLPQHPPLLDSNPAPGCQLVISGLHFDRPRNESSLANRSKNNDCDFHTVDGLRIYFEQFGLLDQVEILGHPRGYGYIVYADRASADACISYNGGRHIVNERRVDVRRYDFNSLAAPLPVTALAEQLAMLQMSPMWPHYLAAAALAVSGNGRLGGAGMLSPPNGGATSTGQQPLIPLLQAQPLISTQPAQYVYGQQQQQQHEQLQPLIYDYRTTGAMQFGGGELQQHHQQQSHHQQQQQQTNLTQTDQLPQIRGQQQAAVVALHHRSTDSSGVGSAVSTSPPAGESEPEEESAATTASAGTTTGPVSVIVDETGQEATET